MNGMPPKTRLRLGWAEAAIFALEHCRPEHANAICVQWLHASETDGPRHDPFGMLYSDARFWAAVAPPHELVAYTLAGLERLPRNRLPLPVRRTMFKALWRSFSNSERTAFIRHVDGGQI